VGRTAARRSGRLHELAVDGAHMRLSAGGKHRSAGAGLQAPPILELDGEFDLDTVPELDRFLRRHLGPLYHQENLVIDLAGATFVDSSFISFVVRLVSAQRVERKELVLARPAGQVRRVLCVVGLANIVPVFESLEEAVGALSSGESPVIPPAFSAVSS
jgi:anti-sigma B factor antagonist